MTPPLSLLAPSDFSAHPRHAPARAAQLASAHPRAQLTLTHVISASVLSRLRGMVGDEGAHGAPTLRILGHEQSLDADLIVRGKYGSRRSKLLLGSVTRHVLAARAAIS